MKILVVEDNIPLCKLYSRVLEQVDAELILAHSCQMAVDVLQQTTPDLVLLDMGLPDGSGQAVIDYIHAHVPQHTTNIVVISGNEQRRNRELLATVDEVLLKPVSTLTLMDTVQHFTKARAA